MQKFETREQIEFFNDGVKLFGILHRPLGENNPPVVMFCHGLAGSKVGKARMYVHMSECLSRIGIASFRFDFRGSGDSEGDFSEMTLENEVNDAIQGLDCLSAQPNLNMTRIGLFARSFGAVVAIKTAYRFENIKSMALWAPVFNGNQWEEKWEQLQLGLIPEGNRHHLLWVNGQMPSMDFYSELFCLSMQEELEFLQQTPILFVHGEKDPIVSIEHTEKYLEMRNGPQALTKFLKLQHSDHDFSHPEERLHATNHTCQWFAKTL